MSIAKYMNNIIQNETNQYGDPVHFGSFQSFEPRLDTGLAAWADLANGYDYQFLTSHSTTPRGGSSERVTLPATKSLDQRADPNDTAASLVLRCSTCSSPGRRGDQRHAL